MSKARIFKKYESLDEEIIEQIKLAYPRGFENKLILFKNAKNEFVSALPFETDEFYFLIKMTKDMAKEIIEEDEDYDDEGNLKEDIFDELTEKFDDEE